MTSPKVAIVWRGDREAQRNATPANNRFHRVFEELAAVGVHAEPAVYDDAFADEVREQLLAGRWRAGLGRSDPSGQDAGGARSAAARDRRTWALGQRASRRDPQDGRQGSPAPHEASRAGAPTRISTAAPANFATRFRRGCNERPAGPEAESWQWRAGSVEGRAVVRLHRRGHAVRVLHAQRGSVPEELPLGDIS